SLVARVGIWVTDIDEGVTLDFRKGSLVVYNGLQAKRDLTIRAQAGTVMNLSNLKIGLLGMPIYYDEVGRSVAMKLVQGKLDIEAKRAIFEAVDGLAPPDAILASNSSTIGISKLADVTRRPERCLNMHFFYPVLVMDLVEIVRGPKTSDDAVERAVALARQIGRTPVVLNKEIDGFIVNRILHAATQEAYRLLDAGVASFEDIDIAVEKGLNWPMGPFRLGDFSGLDVTYNARLHMYRSTGDDRYKPSPQLEAKGHAGPQARKRGEGWYRYEK